MTVVPSLARPARQLQQLSDKAGPVRELRGIRLLGEKPAYLMAELESHRCVLSGSFERAKRPLPNHGIYAVRDPLRAEVSFFRRSGDERRAQESAGVT